MESASAELESFRQQWRDEVTARLKGKNAAGATAGEAASARKSQAHSKEPSRVLATPLSPPARQSQAHAADDTARFEAAPAPASVSTGPALSRNNEPSSKAPVLRQEPSNSALEHFEKAVEKEAQGKLGDSLMHYRQAYRVRFTPFWFSSYEKPDADFPVAGRRR
jgi:F-box protein 9